MAEHLTIKEILALNPQISKKTLEEIQKALGEKYEGKMVRHRYSLIPPFARPRVTVGEGDRTDHRTVILRQTKK